MCVHVVDCVCVSVCVCLSVSVCVHACICTDEHGWVLASVFETITIMNMGSRDA